MVSAVGRLADRFFFNDLPHKAKGARRLDRAKTTWSTIARNNGLPGLGKRTESLPRNEVKFISFDNYAAGLLLPK
jgi:hypothetical protein